MTTLCRRAKSIAEAKKMIAAAKVLGLNRVRIEVSAGSSGVPGDFPARWFDTDGDRIYGDRDAYSLGRTRALVDWAGKKAYVTPEPGATILLTWEL